MVAQACCAHEYQFVSVRARVQQLWNGRSFCETFPQEGELLSVNRWAQVHFTCVRCCLDVCASEKSFTFCLSHLC